MRSVRVIACGLGLLLAAGCAATPPAPASPSPSPSVSASPTPKPVFADAELVWAQRSTVYVDDLSYDLSPHVVQWLAWSPSRLYLGERDGDEYRVVAFDGADQTDLGSVDGRVVTSPDGDLAAWIDRDGPERPAGKVAQLVVQDTETGEIVYTTSEGMGGEKGDDLGDRYEELPPSVTAIRDRSVFWKDAEGGGGYVVTDLDSGASQRAETDWPVRLTLTAGYLFSSPDGEYLVDASETGKLNVTPRQPDFGGQYQTHAGWSGDHTLLAVVQDEYAWSWDPNVPDETPGRVVACDLELGTCTTRAEVVGTRDLAFAGALQE